MAVNTVIELEPSRVWIVVPAFNEAKTIKAVVEPLLDSGYKVVVVDDGSRDETVLVAQLSGATTLRHLFNTGQGAALQTGIDFALQAGAEYICTFDADGQHRKEDIQILCQYLFQSGVEICLGSRFKGSAINIRTGRRLLLKAGLLFTRIHTGLRLSDTHNGLRLMTRRAAQQIRLHQPRMAHASEFLKQIATLNISFTEAPVSLVYTSHSIAKGQSAAGALRILFDLLIARALK